MRRQKYKNIQRGYLMNDNVTMCWHLGVSTKAVCCRLSVVSKEDCVLLSL
jgi:hypothetical protein